MSTDQRPLLAVVGATATGKSDLAVELALALDGEVVNADAMQLYRGLDIGTAKIAPAERRGVPHHLLDVLDPTEEASVSAYQEAAGATIAGIRGRGRLPILVGGSGLYVRAVTDGLRFPGTSAPVRARLEAELDEQGTGPLHARLLAADPEAGRTVGVGDARRIVRALEVIELTGRPWTASLPGYTYAASPTLQIGLARPRESLHRRVAERVDRMFESGLLDEVRTLTGRGLREAPTAGRAIGYRQALAVLDGDLPEPQARQETAAATRRLVRKQDTWFRRDPRIAWIAVENRGSAQIRAEGLGLARATLDA